MRKTTVALAAILAFLSWRTFANVTASHVLPAPAADVSGIRSPQVAVLSGGCFWGVQGVFEHVRGVTSAVSGYTGGPAAAAYYEEVSGGNTGHAESVKVTYDPASVSYGEILKIFFSVVADPITVDAQGPDRGSQYRSEIWTSDAEQTRVAKDYISQLDATRVFGAPIVTRVNPAGAFYPAERYHQDFLEEHPAYPYIVINDLPKVAALKRLFPGDYVEAATTTGLPR